MKIETETIEVLRNFSQINQSILLKEGKVQRTVSPHKVVLAEATLKQALPRKCAIFDLPQFLDLLTFADQPEVDFGDRKLTISDAQKSKSSIRYAHEGNIISPPEETLAIPKPHIDLIIKEVELKNVLKAAKLLTRDIGKNKKKYEITYPDITLIGRNGVLYLTAFDRRQAAADRYEAPIGKTKGSFQFVFNIEHLKLLPRDYDVEVSPKGISRWVSKTGDVRYFIATKTSSQFAL